MRGIVLAAALSAVACGSDHGSPDAAALDAPALDAATDAGPAYGDVTSSFCAPLAQMICTRAASCGCGAFDVDLCVTLQTQACTRENAPGIAMGEQIALASMRRCFALLAESDTCDAVEIDVCDSFVGFPRGTPSGCPDFFPCDDGNGVCSGGACIPLQVEGGSCAIAPCGSGLTCRYPAQTCERLLAPGEACSDVSDCAPPGRCVLGRCLVSVAPGGACETTDACEAGMLCTGGTCVAQDATCDGTCGRASRCERATTCQPPLEADAPCSAASDCASGACPVDRCLPGLAIGQACTSGYQTNCAAGAFCDAPPLMAGVCRARGLAGAACRIDVAQGCVDGLACIGSVCAARTPAIGEPCGEGAPCAPSATCDPGGSCAAFAGVGDSCTSAACAPSLSCGSSSRCEPGPALGEVCANGECDCLPSRGGVPVCMPPPGAGDPCGPSAACPTRLVCRASGSGACRAPICDQLFTPF